MAKMVITSNICIFFILIIPIINIKPINIGTINSFTFTTPFILVINTIKVIIAKIKLPTNLFIPISCSK